MWDHTKFNSTEQALFKYGPFIKFVSVYFVHKLLVHAVQTNTENGTLQTLLQKSDKTLFLRHVLGKKNLAIFLGITSLF